MDRGKDRTCDFAWAKILRWPPRRTLRRHLNPAKNRQPSKACAFGQCRRGLRAIVSLRQNFLPHIVSCMVRAALFAFIASWCEFLAALTFVNKETAFTVPIKMDSVRTSQAGLADCPARRPHCPLFNRPSCGSSHGLGAMDSNNAEGS